MDLTFPAAQGKFTFRVGAIIVHDGKILMVKNTRASYYYSVGGRVKFNETCAAAVVREVREELGFDMEIDYPAFLHENLFDDRDTGEHFHEIALYYVMKPLRDYSGIVCRSFVEADGAEEALEWLSIDELSLYPAYPSFFASELKTLRRELKHIV